jgi:mannosyltransferase OCH1-like enzyme
MTIPKVLHQTWKTRQLPAEFAAFRQSWQRRHPDWDCRLYDDTDCRRLVAENYPALLPLYEAYPTNVQRADLFRYLAVHLHGGVYADVDMECLKPLGPLLDRQTCVLGIEAVFGDYLRRRLGYHEPYQVANCIFAAEPGHPFFSLLIDRLPIVDINAPVSHSMVEDTTGPRFLTRLFQEQHDRFPDIRLLPQIHWIPPLRPAWPNFFPFNIHIYCKHHFAGTWKDAIGETGSSPQRFRERWHHPWPWFRRDFHPRQAWQHLRDAAAGVQASARSTATASGPGADFDQR